MNTVSTEPKFAPAPTEAPRRSSSSAICLLVRLWVPSRSICAVAEAKPDKLAGSKRAPASRICNWANTLGRRWSSKIKTVSPFASFTSTGFGRWTRSVSLDTGALFLRSTLLEGTAKESCPETVSGRAIRTAVVNASSEINPMRHALEAFTQIFIFYES